MNGFFRKSHSTTVQMVHNSSNTNTVTYNNNTTHSIDKLSTSLSSNNTNYYYSNYLSNKFHIFKNNLIHIKRPLNNSSVNRVCLNSQENNDYNPLFNDSFTFNWNTLCIDEYKNVQNTNTTTTNNNTDNNHLQDNIASCMNNTYHPMTLGYLTEEDIQLIQRYYKLYQSKLLSLTKKNTRIKNCHFTTRRSILEQLGRLTDDEKQVRV
ncbi:unnamed protein product [Trichobilharzia regenti]|nr:unnamed protein product [Trichobilharzia regenti]